MAHAPRIKASMCRLKAAAYLILLFVVVSHAGAEEGVHVLSRNETIYGVARRYGLRADDLLSYNNIDDDQARSLPIGYRLRIPGTYVVQEGEYPFSIARELGVNWLELLEANGLTRDSVVRSGDVLVIPGRGVSPSTSESVAVERTGSDAAEATNGVSESAQPAETQMVWPHVGTRRDYDGRFTAVVIDASSGDEVLSVTSGQVSYIGPFMSFGRMVIVQSANGYKYVYMGTETVLVELGDEVEPGMPLGLIGYSPALKDSDVLFTVWYGNRFVHPSVAPRG